ncbi:hypothetical protein NDU88_006312 [Pleurodeles waltl]|uniref:Uncharacterized protein n=1 Tax=Pleurodeles waltl TaxID=8319 RepID=A0AAV7WA81_PLEWA|nr:hypothetical protein NDU88_006312 [Pleurodeles waltl]
MKAARPDLQGSMPEKVKAKPKQNEAVNVKQAVMPDGKRVSKTCSEFEERIGEADSRISKFEDDAAARSGTGDALNAQLKDTQWKLADLEDRLRRNNL